MDVPLSWLVISVCVLGSFFFSASETALSCCNRFKISVKADDGSKTAKLLLKVCHRFDRALTVVLIGNNVVAIIASVISTILFKNIVPGAFSETGISLLSSICMSLLFYVLGDTFPKTIARAIPDTLSYLFVYPIYFLMILFYPIALLFELMGKGFEKMFKVKNDEKFTEEDFESAVEKVSDDGVIDDEQTEIIQSALDFTDTNVKEVLTPKEKIFALDIKDLTHTKLKEVLLNTNYSRIPVYEGNFNNFIGVLLVKNYFQEIVNNPNASIRKLLKKCYFVTPNIMIDDLFNGFKTHHSHLAIVRDKNHQTLGMVTMEDVLEELVSDISEPSTPKVKA